MRPIDLVGNRYCRLTVISRLENIRVGSCSRRIWLCECDCGNQLSVLGGALQSGNTKSCGCLKIDLKTTHGKTRAREYRVWAGIIQRCENQNYKRYHDYGGRGISVCDEWKSFDQFFADMGERPSPEHSIDRKNNDLGYSAENCKWSTRSEQQLNKRTSKKNSQDKGGES